jgi:hypothetical protein
MGVLQSAMRSGCLLGAIGFAGGFFGPMIFMPESNQGPLFGIFFSGPAGFVVGSVGGALIAGWRRYRS